MIYKMFYCQIAIKQRQEDKLTKRQIRKLTHGLTEKSKQTKINTCDECNK